MKVLLAILLLVATVLLVGSCKRGEPSGSYNASTMSLKSIDINDSPIADSEQAWAWKVVSSWPKRDSYLVQAAIITWSTAEGVKFKKPICTDKYLYNKVKTRWGCFYFADNFDGWRRDMYVTVDVDGVDQVYEPGRWWRVIREELNRMAATLDSTQREQSIRDSVARINRDSIRLFKLDSAMKAIGK